MLSLTWGGYFSYSHSQSTIAEDNSPGHEDNRMVRLLRIAVKPDLSLFNRRVNQMFAAGSLHAAPHLLSSEVLMTVYFFTDAFLCLASFYSLQRATLDPWCFRHESDHSKSVCSSWELGRGLFQSTRKQCKLDFGWIFAYSCQTHLHNDRLFWVVARIYYWAIVKMFSFPHSKILNSPLSCSKPV